MIRTIRDSRRRTRSGQCWNRPDNMALPSSFVPILNRTIWLRGAVVAVHRRRAAEREGREQRLRGRGEARPEGGLLLGREALQHPVGRIDRQRRSPDAEAQARKVLAAEVRDQVLEPAVAAGAPAWPEPQPPER